MKLLYWYSCNWWLQLKNVNNEIVLTDPSLSWWQLKGVDWHVSDEESEKQSTVIVDSTETNLMTLRRTIYLTIQSSLDFEECAHKLIKMQLKPGQEARYTHLYT